MKLISPLATRTALVAAQARRNPMPPIDKKEDTCSRAMPRSVVDAAVALCKVLVEEAPDNADVGRLIASLDSVNRAVDCFAESALAPQLVGVEPEEVIAEAGTMQSAMDAAGEK